MADAMVRRKTTEREAIRKEEELLVFSRPYLSDAFPNPERTGCPPDDALRLMAIRPLGCDESVSEHLTCCSPCFNAYTGYLVQTKAKIRRTTSIRRSAAALGIAATLVMPGMPSMNMPEMRATGDLSWNGREYGGTINVPMAGFWNTTIEATRNGRALASEHARLTAH
jgi:hypothetical protein